MQQLGEKIYKLRKQQGLSQEELGLQLNVSRQTISKWEANIATPGLDNLKQLSIVFNVSTDYFLSDENIGAQINGEEIAFATTDVSKPKKYKMYLVLSVIFAVFTIVLILITTCAGLVTLSPNKGDELISTSQIDSYTFYIWLVISVLCFAIDSAFILLYFIKKRKS